MLSNLQKTIDDAKLDALFVTKRTNIFYLTGFKGTYGYVLVTKNHIYLFTDGRYIEKARKAVNNECRVIDATEGLMHKVHNMLVKHRVKAIGVEGKDITFSMYNQFNILNGFKIRDAGELVEEFRMIKTKDELRAMRQSQRFNEQVLKLIIGELKVGVTEADIAWRIGLIAHDLGACGLSFAPIVAFGGHTAMPHHEVSAKKKLKRGDMILIDMGMKCNDYCSDMTRTFFTKVPTSQQAEVYNTVLEANQRAIKMAKPGNTCDAVDKEARRHISHSGYSKKFTHSTGHGIGLDVHEPPKVGKFVDSVLKPGVVITVEPGIYLPGKLGVRIEDMVEIQEKGNQVLTKYPKDIDSVILKI